MKAKLKAECSKEKLKYIRGFVKESIEILEATDLEKEQIVLAIDEVCANAIIHGNQTNDTKQIILEIDVTETSLKVDISDIGLYDPEELAGRNKDIADIVKDKQKGGMGLKLVYSIMDNVEYYIKNNMSICSLTKVLK
ncbi:MAG: ATP-binding protein [Bacteroidetes bacterium]|nr:ATP-binding protein [Bacteroidota bacterium]